MKEGYEITFANPKAITTRQMDVHSAVPDFFGGDEARLQDYLKFRDTLTGLKNPTRILFIIQRCNSPAWLEANKSCKFNRDTVKLHRYEKDHCSAEFKSGRVLFRANDRH